MFDWPVNIKIFLRHFNVFKGSQYKKCPKEDFPHEAKPGRNNREIEDTNNLNL